MRESTDQDVARILNFHRKRRLTHLYMLLWLLWALFARFAEAGRFGEWPRRWFDWTGDDTVNEVTWMAVVVFIPGTLLYALRFIYSRFYPHEESTMPGLGSGPGLMESLRRNPDNKVVRRWGWVILLWTALILILRQLKR